MSVEHNTRDFDPDIVTDLRELMSYGGYLRYDALAPVLTRIARVMQIQLTVFEADPPAHALLTEMPYTFRGIYENAAENWAADEACEELVDLEDNSQLWRFRHLKTVQRIIGLKTATGGSRAAAILQKVLELTFFPELFAGRPASGS